MKITAYFAVLRPGARFLESQAVVAEDFNLPDFEPLKVNQYLHAKARELTTLEVEAVRYCLLTWVRR